MALFDVARATVVSFVLCSPVLAVSLNDTGQVACFDESATSTGTVSAGTPAPEGAGFEKQDCSRGASAADAVGVQLKVGGASVAGRDYTKIANDGSELPDTASVGSAPGDWGCTRDNVTGLIWELHPNDGGVRDRDHRYSWKASTNADGDTCAGTLTPTCNSDAYIAAVNAVGLCGASDWQLPTPAQLEGLLAYADPAGSLNLIDRTWFPDQVNDGMNPFLVWSDQQADTLNLSAWAADFDFGWTAIAGQASAGFVRLVRASTAPGGTRFTVSEPVAGEAVVTDAVTGLVWKQCPQGLSGADCSTGTLSTLDWSGALTAAAGESFAGFGDWRLPNIIELASIRDYTPVDFGTPAISTEFAGTTDTQQYWSSTNDPRPTSLNTALAYQFADSTAHNTLFKTGNLLAVRLVRGGNFLSDHAPGLDTTPAAFTIADGSAAAGSLAESTAVVISGLTGPASLTVSGAEQSAYSINGGNYTVLAGAVHDGDSLRVRHLTAATIGGTAVTTVNVGGASATFTSTAADPRTPQTITFGANPGPLAYGTAGASVSATASSGLTIEFGTTTPAVCSVDGASGALTLVTAGNCIITADQAGDATWLAAPQATQTVVITKASQSITFIAPIETDLTTAPLTLSASGGNSGNPLVIASQSTGVCTAGTWQNGSVDITLLATGTCTLTANQAGDVRYDAAPEVTRVIAIVPPATTPRAPTNLVITANVEGVTLSFDAPADNGGAPILYYEYVGDGVTQLPGHAEGRCEASPCEVTGLPGGTIMSFEVRAVNRVGAGPGVSDTSPSIASSAGTFPGAVTGLRTTFLADRSIGLAWDPLASAAAETIVYLIQIRVVGDVAFTDVGVTSSTFVSVTGLDPQTSYEVRALGVDGAGTQGTPSDLLPATTSGSTPDLYFINDTPTTFPEDFRGDPGHVLEAIENGSPVTTVLFSARPTTIRPKKFFITPGASDGTVTTIYSPKLGKLFRNQVGEIDLRYRAFNNVGRSNAAWVTISLTGVNDPPLLSFSNSTSATKLGGKAAAAVQVPGFVSSTHPGAANEQTTDGQQVVGYVVEPDPANVEPSPISGVSVDAAGTLHYTLDSNSPNAAGYRYGFYVMARDDGDDRYNDGTCARNRTYGPYDQRACSPPRKATIVVGAWSGVNLSAYRDTQLELDEELADLAEAAAAKYALEDPDQYGEDVADPGSPGPVRYRLDASNLGGFPVAGATLTTSAIIGLEGVTWTCTTPVGACTPASGTGAVSTTFGLGADSSDNAATVTVTGTPNDVDAWVRIVAKLSMPSGEAADTPTDTAVVIDSMSPDAIFLGGFE